MEGGEKAFKLREDQYGFWQLSAETRDVLKPPVHLRIVIPSAAFFATAAVIRDGWAGDDAWQKARIAAL
jgi:hypothetical protein